MNFDQFAKDWWDPSGSMAPLHTIHPLRMAFFEKHLPEGPLRIWDAGCGGGLISLSLAENPNYHIQSTDLSDDLITIAKAKAQSLDKNNVLFQTCDIMEHTEAEGFDVIVCSEVLEHVDNVNATLEHFDKLLKPGGTLLLTTINRTPQAFAFAIVGAEYILGLLPRGTHRFEKLVKPSEIISPLQRRGYQLLDMSGISYNPFTKKATTCRSVAINYMLALKK